MTLEAFLHELDVRGIRFENARNHWRTPTGECPICALYHAMFPDHERLENAELGEAAERIGLDDGVAGLVVLAADILNEPIGRPEAAAVRCRLLTLAVAA